MVLGCEGPLARSADSGYRWHRIVSRAACGHRCRGWPVGSGTTLQSGPAGSRLFNVASSRWQGFRRLPRARGWLWRVQQVAAVILAGVILVVALVIIAIFAGWARAHPSDVCVPLFQRGGVTQVEERVPNPQEIVLVKVFAFSATGGSACTKMPD